MSTVLDALREQQHGTAGGMERAPLAMDRRWRRPWLLIAILSIPLLGILLLVIWPSSVPRTSPPPPAILPGVQAAARQPVPAAPLPEPSPAIEEPPRGHINENTLTAPKPLAAPKAQRATRAQAQPEAAAANHGAAAASMPETGVRVKSIRYSPDAAKRTVTLSRGNQAATLHEGQSVYGVEVQLILPNMIYIRDGASVSAIAAGP